MIYADAEWLAHATQRPYVEREPAPAAAPKPKPEPAPRRYRINPTWDGWELAALHRYYVLPTGIDTLVTMTGRGLDDIYNMARRLGLERPAGSRHRRRVCMMRHPVTYRGRTMPLCLWAKEIGLPRPVLYDRVARRGMAPERAFTMPVRHKARRAA